MKSKEHLLQSACVKHHAGSLSLSSSTHSALCLGSAANANAAAAATAAVAAVAAAPAAAPAAVASVLAAGLARRSFPQSPGVRSTGNARQ